MDNPNKLPTDRDLFHRLPYSASLFNISRQFGKNEYLETNRSMDFTQAAAAAAKKSNVGANRGRPRQAKTNAPKKESCPLHSAGMVRSSSQYGQEGKAQSNFFQDGRTDDKRAWRAVPRDSRVLSLDLFRQVPITKGQRLLETPTKTKWAALFGHGDDRDDAAEGDYNHSHAVPLSAVRPLLEFRQLVHLTLTGMMRSYQPVIWRVVWLQPFLRRLSLSMALDPVFNVETDQPHRLIDGTWTLNNGYRDDPAISEYLGHHGEGILHEEFGDGEYLDAQAIKMARAQVSESLPFNNERFLPVEKLSLERFVVDGGSIMRWFGPQRLRHIEFKDGCIDAGLYLGPDMGSVRVTAPTAQTDHDHGSISHHHRVARAVKMGELKVVDLKQGRVLSRKDACTGREEVGSAQKQPKLKVKMSQLMHGWTSKRKGWDNSSSHVMTA